MTWSAALPFAVNLLCLVVSTVCVVVVTVLVIRELYCGPGK